MTLPMQLRRALVRRHGQLSRVLPARYHAYPFPGGRIYLDLRESPTMLARALGIYEPAKAARLREHLRPGMTFVDVGVNKGDFSLIAARAMGDRGRVLAFEPEPENCTWIRRSVERNGYRCIELLQLALSDEDGEATLYLGERSGWHTLVPGVAGRDQGAITVARRTLDGVLAERGVERVDAIKIDVEGAEMEVLRGATATLGGDHPLLVLLDIHPPLADPREVCALLAGHGLSMHPVDNPELTLDEVPPRLTEVLARR
jgi:FkbM family methyltransferase